ncbi:amino acid adenylation domain-containing protein [Actinosynnema sp. NPDC023794]
MTTSTAREAGPGLTDHTCLPDLLRDQARAHPDRTAVTYGNHRLTYRELETSSSRLAAYLLHLGVVAEDCVGLFVDPSMDLMIGSWGILFAGAAYLPLSPEYPEGRLRYMIDDSRTKVILAQEELRARLVELAPPGTRIITLEDVAAFATSLAPGGDLDLDLGAGPGPDDLAYLIYTSGSTGKPKGVMIEHRGVVNQMRWLLESFELDHGKVILQKTPMSFDAAQWEILAPGCGASVVIGSPGIYRDTEALIDTIRTHGVTTVQCVPTLLQALLETDELQTCKSLEQVFSGGEVLSRVLATSFLETMPGCRLINLYGPTECTINSSSFTVDRDTVGASPNAISIGTPAHGIEYYVVDAHGTPVAVGEIGELCVSGVQVARGYLRLPELSAERFTANPHSSDPRFARLFRTGDLAHWNADGTVQFAGRVDNQVKLRGFRVELDEIKLAIETHEWVKHVAVLVKKDPRTGFQNLIACVELNPREAAVMDQGNHDAHHQSKESKLQVMAQLSNPGLRDVEQPGGRPAIDLSDGTSTAKQRAQAFARKTYRFYEGGDVTEDDILRLLYRQVRGTRSRGVDTLDLPELAGILRYFGQHVSTERLLPKYGYASPGSLYATQMFLELSGIPGIESGCYYYHPVDHRLVPIGEAADSPAPRLKLHFMGKNQAIEPVYKNNIREVLEIETGHMIGLFEEVLPEHGLDVEALEHDPAVAATLGGADDDLYLGTFEVVPHTGPRPDSVDVYVQVHAGSVAGLPAGMYAWEDGGLEWIADEVVLKKDVIAINQQVYDRADIGISVVSRTDDDRLEYVDLGRKLQHLSMNDLNLGFMSSGYSSKTGNDLPSAKRLDAVLKACGRPTGPSYFFVGGRVSDEQRRSEGMKEDAVHMQGPAEMIKEDLIDFLPDYMIPNKVVIMAALPFSANGKIDTNALAAMPEADVDADQSDRPFVAPATNAERRIVEIWKKALKRESVSTQDDFFAFGGNSLIAVAIINKINREFLSALPLQSLFEAPTVARLARLVTRADVEQVSRLVPLQIRGSGRPVYCWPGLGGYPMSLRLLAAKTGVGRPFYGVQAHGINEGEEPRSTIVEMAAEDLQAIRKVQPHGPYELWGYSFGARVAFEAARQLEQSGERVENLFLIAPGSPKVSGASAPGHGRRADYADKTYVTILFSVFAGTITGPLLEECLAEAVDDESFAAFIGRTFKDLDADLVHRIIGVVTRTFEFDYTFRELAGRRIQAPVTIFKAQGDDYSSLETGSGYSAADPVVVDLEADHYTMLKQPDVNELARAVRHRHDERTADRKGLKLPHVNIKHFPTALTREKHSELVVAVTTAVTNAFDCDEGAVSILIEPVTREAWDEEVGIPEIVNREGVLAEAPNSRPEAN